MSGVASSEGVDRGPDMSAATSVGRVEVFARPGLVIAAAVATGAGLVLVSLDRPASTARTYGAASDLAQGVEQAAAFVLAAVGVLGWIGRAEDVEYRLCVAISLLWLAGEITGSTVAPATVTSVSMVIEHLLVAVLAHLALAHPHGGLRGSIDRSIVACAYVIACTVAVSRALMYDPFLDVGCWRNCSTNVFLVSAQPDWWDVIHRVWLWSVPALAAIVVLRVAPRLARGSRGRPWAPWVVGTAALACVAEGIRSATLLVVTEERPDDLLFSAVFVGRGIVLLALGLFVGAGLASSILVRRSLVDLVDEIGFVGAGSVVARSLGDDRVQVAYWLPNLGRHVDGEGRPLRLDDVPPSSTLDIERGGEHVGFVLNARWVTDHDVDRLVGPAVRLAFDNERLRAGLLAQVSELRASQARIVERADATRRQIERDLHDGAQQRLLALSYDIRLARSAATAAGDTDAEMLLAEALEEVQVALAELRDLAHGIFPAVLSTAGLAAALDALRDAAPILLSIDVDDRRCDPNVEVAAYLLVAEILHSVEQGDVCSMAVSAARRADRLELEVVGVPIADLTHAIDRVGALGGDVRVEERRVQVVIPCAP